MPYDICTSMLGNRDAKSTGGINMRPLRYPLLLQFPLKN